MKYLIAVIILINLSLFAQDSLKYKLDEIVVTSSAAPITFSDIARSIIIMPQKEISQLPASSINELFQYSAGMDLRQRGVEGVQSDLSIRGGTFEQTLVLINGIKVIDPQTGHHNLNLPFMLNDIARIEVLKGPGSRIFGANAFSGAVNIITKKDAQNSIFVNLVGGENAYFKQGISGSFKLANLSNRISYQRTKSDGYTHNTAFEDIGFSYQSTMNFSSASVNALFGYNDKKFGANSFYSSLYPNQWEHNKTKFVNLSAEIGNNNFSFQPKIYWRRNDDRYLLEYTNPSFYENIHQTDSYGFELSSSFKSSLGQTSIGGEFSKDKITSTNLGDHTREKKGFFIEQQINLLDNFNFNAGAYIYKYDKIDWKVWPGFDLSYTLNKNTRFYASYGQGFRIPTFTELYYSSPANIGNKDLASEEVTTYEIGTYLNFQNIFVNAALFLKDGSNIIDWYRTNENDPWQVRNIANVTTRGMDFSISYSFNQLFINSISLGYTYLDIDKESTSFDSRYFLENLKHQAVLKINHQLIFGISQTWNFRYEDRLNYDGYFLVDTKLVRAINNFTLSISFSNLFNSSYQDFTGLPLPGRWIKAGIQYQLNNL